MALAAGIYPDYPVDEYHADPCHVPSLNQTTAKVLLDKSPLHARHQHPRLSPDWEPREHKKFAIGNVAHRLLIDRGKSFKVFDAPDWKGTGLGKGGMTQLHADRDDAIAAGIVPILAHQYDTASAMTQAARIQLSGNPSYSDAFERGQGEVVIVAERDGIWFRSMIDWMVDPTMIYDYKTTDASAAPNDVMWRMTDTEWPVQAAMQEFILDILHPETAGRRRHRFVIQEAYEPYALTVCELPEAVMHIGRSKLARAIDIWTRCITEDRWPGYGTDVIYPEYPPHVAARWMEREAMAGEGK